jgi:hypothetical protein
MTCGLRRKAAGTKSCRFGGIVVIITKYSAGEYAFSG